MALRRIIREFNLLEKEPPIPCKAESVDEDVYHWIQHEGPMEPLTVKEFFI